MMRGRDGPRGSVRRRQRASAFGVSSTTPRGIDEASDDVMSPNRRAGGRCIFFGSPSSSVMQRGFQVESRRLSAWGEIKPHKVRVGPDRRH